MPNCVTSWLAHLRVLAPASNTASSKTKKTQRWRAVGNTVSAPKFEPQTSRFGDEGVIVQTTGRLS